MVSVEVCCKTLMVSVSPALTGKRVCCEILTHTGVQIINSVHLHTVHVHCESVDPNEDQMHANLVLRGEKRRKGKQTLSKVV